MHLTKWKYETSSCIWFYIFIPFIAVINKELFLSNPQISHKMKKIGVALCLSSALPPAKSSRLPDSDLVHELTSASHRRITNLQNSELMPSAKVITNEVESTNCCKEENEVIGGMPSESDQEEDLSTNPEPEKIDEEETSSRRLIPSGTVFPQPSSVGIATEHRSLASESLTRKRAQSQSEASREARRITRKGVGSRDIVREL